MDYIIRPYRQGEERYVADVHRKVYGEEYHWSTCCTDYAAKIAEEFPLRAKSEREEMWVAEADGKLIGSIMLCQTDDSDTGQLRLFLVEKEYRGCGVGNALLAILLERARAIGYMRLILWTASPLGEAIRQYQKVGFHITEKVVNTEWRLDGTCLYEIKMEMTIVR